MGNHGKGSMDHCSEREKESLGSWSVYSAFALYIACRSWILPVHLTLWGYWLLITLTLPVTHSNHLLQSFPPSRSFVWLEKQCDHGWGGGDIMWMQVERQEEIERVLVRLLNQKSESWIINGSGRSVWCGMASSALMQPPTLFSATLWLHKDNSDVSNTTAAQFKKTHFVWRNANGGYDCWMK